MNSIASQTLPQSLRGPFVIRGECVPLSMRLCGIMRRYFFAGLILWQTLLLVRADEPAFPFGLTAVVESNWVAQAYIDAAAKGPDKMATSDDAAGAVDGVKNGKWGFHTGLAENPWWQVDLGSVTTLDRVLVWNRCDAPATASRMQLLLSKDGRQWEMAYQHNGQIFYGFTDKKPLEIKLQGRMARFLRVQFPGKTYCYMDEFEVFGTDAPDKNIALRRPADQISLSQWSRPHLQNVEPDWGRLALDSLNYCMRVAKELEDKGISTTAESAALERLSARLNSMPRGKIAVQDYVEARRLQRKLALANPLLDFDAILFTKRVPASYNHMSDQYYGWWSQPGGGIYVLKNFRSEKPTVECLTGAFTNEGSFLRPALSYDGKKVLFAWARHYKGLAREANKLDKSCVPEDAFYHLFEMNVDGTGLRQLTHGKYDDFDGRYLPDGRIVFLSTRRGQFIQTGRETAAKTCKEVALPDCYVRCGGGPERPVAVYTLHTMDADGGNLTAISPFEMFEWTPSVHHDGTILYSRWDYIDRDNMPYMGLWSVRPDGSNPRVVYGNYTKSPHCTFEPMPVPNSHKIVFTASGHHAQTMGSLVLLDPSVGTEGKSPVTRLTPEVCFPEIEGWPRTYYSSPWPLSERFYLVAWGGEGLMSPGPEGWQRWHAVQRPSNGMALYLFDAAGTRELLYIDPQITCTDPIPLKPRPTPPVLARAQDDNQIQEGYFVLSDVYRGLKTVQRGQIKALRLIAVPPKTHPTMNYPNIGITRDDPGKCVLGTVPVESDGSAYFRAPANVIMFFQALDERGVAVQTMRSVVHVQPGQTLGCAGCHEDRQTAPRSGPFIAAMRAPSKITAGPPGSWPLRFDRLVQPVLDAHCVECHRPQSQDLKAARVDLTPPKAYQTLVEFGKPSLTDQVWAGYRRGYSIEGDGIAARSALLALIDGGHYNVKLDASSRERLIVWMDAYAQKLGSFSPEQETQLEQFRAACSDFIMPWQGGDPRATAFNKPSDRRQ